MVTDSRYIWLPVCGLGLLLCLLLTLSHCCFGFANSVLKVIGASLNYMGTRHDLWIAEENVLAKQKLRMVVEKLF